MFFFVVLPSVSMPNTPTRNTRSGSNSSNITLADIKTLMESNKKEMLSKLGGEIGDLKEMVGSLLERVKELENNNNLLELKVQRLEYERDNAVREAISASLSEFEDIDRRRKNVIIFGVPEIDNVSAETAREEERRKLKEICDHVDADSNDILTCFRIGGRGQKPRPLKLKMKSQDSKEKMLLNARQLRTFRRVGWNERIFIKPDMTRRQQESMKLLRAELKTRNSNGEDLIIRDGKLIPRRPFHTHSK